MIPNLFKPQINSDIYLSPIKRPNVLYVNGVTYDTPGEPSRKDKNKSHAETGRPDFSSMNF